jgi:hypothetical protein
MKKIHDSLLLVVAVVCCIIIPLFIWAQEGEVKDSHVPPSGFVMKFERMGGYAGIYDSFWIYPDGQVINLLGKRAEISPDIVGQWLKTITPHAGPPLSDALMKSSTESLCFDCFVYQITIYDKDGTRTIKLAGPLKDSDDVAKTFSGMRDRLQRLLGSPLMGAPVQVQEQKR